MASGSASPCATFLAFRTCEAGGGAGCSAAIVPYPLRLSIDAGAVDDGNPNPAQAVLGVHATHGRSLRSNLRIYAFAASLGGQRVLDGTRALAHQSKIPAKQVLLVDRHTTYAHNDPSGAAPAKNVFLKDLIPFLKRIG